MKVALGVLGVFVFIGLLLGLGLATDWFGLVTSRPMQKYQAETDKQVYDSSRTYQQGTQLDISRYCAQYHSATSPSAKSAVAGLIRDTAATYTGPLTPNNQACLSEIGQ